jgi:ubiquinone/menaquinone biosynthesis C-methylase UbiE
MVDEFLNPQKTLETIPLRENMVACDLGSGSGGWTIPLARILKTGVVYAVDILEPAISALNARIGRERIANIKPILSDAEKGVKITGSTVDFVLLSNILFESDDKEAVLKEAKRLLRPEGLALIVDWKEDSSIGVREKRVSFNEVRSLLNNLGFKIEREFDAGKFHWAILIKKI